MPADDNAQCACTGTCSHSLALRARQVGYAQRPHAAAAAAAGLVAGSLGQRRQWLLRVERA
eukprot:27708-Chlamydomonas_euryale.AAC.2